MKLGVQPFKLTAEPQVIERFGILAVGNSTTMHIQLKLFPNASKLEKDREYQTGWILRIQSWK